MYGMIQLKVICVELADTVARLIGGSGVLAEYTSKAGSDYALSPTLFNAETLNLYGFPVTSPVDITYEVVSLFVLTSSLKELMLAARP